MEINYKEHRLLIYFVEEKYYLNSVNKQIFMCGLFSSFCLHVKLQIYHSLIISSTILAIDVNMSILLVSDVQNANFHSLLLNLFTVVCLLYHSIRNPDLFMLMKF